MTITHINDCRVNIVGTKRLMKLRRHMSKLNEGECAACGDASVAISSGVAGDASGMDANGISAVDVLGKKSPDAGFMGDDDFHIPKQVGKLHHRFQCCNGGSTRKRGKNGKPKRYYHEKGMKFVGGYANTLRESDRDMRKLTYVYNISMSRLPMIVERSCIDNPRFNVEQFLKYKSDPNVELVGLFKTDMCCVALAAISYDVAEINDCYICEIQSFVTGHQYGKKLLQHLISHQENVWLMSNPFEDRALTDYYRDPEFGFNEHVVENSIYKRPTHFFYVDGVNESALIEYIDQHYSKRLAESASADNTCSIVFVGLNAGIRWCNGDYSKTHACMQSAKLRNLQEEFESSCSNLQRMYLENHASDACRFLRSHGYDVAFNDYSQSLVEALSKRETAGFIRMLKTNDEVKFKYRKTGDGTIRTARGTLKPEIIHKGLGNKTIPAALRKHKVPNTIIVYWDLDRNAFRSFRKTHFLKTISAKS